MNDPVDDLEAELIDLTGLRLTDLRALGDAPLAYSIRRILEESQDETSGVISTFESGIETFERLNDHD